MSPLTTERAVGVFLKSRQQLIVALVKLSAAVEHDHHDLAEVLLNKFCQSMVDYLSNGYFRIYGDLLTPHTWATQRDYARFESTTATALDFNDRHLRRMPLNLNTIKAELAAVALALETRFELEDELLDRSRDRQAIAV